MDALDSLKDYGSNSSESSDENTEDIQESSEKKETCIKVPALPSAILSMFETKEDIHNDAQLHQGRQRSFPHVPGNWATYVFVEVSIFEEVASLISDLLDCLPKEIMVEPSQSLHISLSKTVTLQYHWIEPFTSDLKEQLLATVPKFTCFLEGVKFYSNDEKTRSFMALTIGKGRSQLQSVVSVVDKCLQEFSLPTFYEEGCFHTSIAWFLGDFRDVLPQSVQDKVQKCFTQHKSIFAVKVDRIKCKSGCKQFSFMLGE